MTRRVLVGGAGAGAAITALLDAGVRAEALGADSARELREADEAGIRYVLVHVGPDDGEPQGSYARAHHRVGPEEVPALALRLAPRPRPLVRCLAFAYKNGLPEDATWLVDARFLDNPYWVDALRPLDGRDPAVRDHVLGQPAAVELLDRLEGDLRWALPRYRSDDLTVAFGCTGGRHRSVVLAGEMARRLADLDGVDVEFVARELDG